LLKGKRQNHFVGKLIERMIIFAALFLENNYDFD